MQKGGFLTVQLDTEPFCQILHRKLPACHDIYKGLSRRSYVDFWTCESDLAENRVLSGINDA